MEMYATIFLFSMREALYFLINISQFLQLHYLQPSLSSMLLYSYQF